MVFFPPLFPHPFNTASMCVKFCSALSEQFIKLCSENLKTFHIKHNFRLYSQSHKSKPFQNGERDRERKAFFWRYLLVCGFNLYFYEMKKACTTFLRRLIFIPTQMEKMVERAWLLVRFKPNPNSYRKKVRIKLSFDLLFRANTLTKETLKLRVHSTFCATCFFKELV